MLVLNARTEISGSEQRVIDWMRTWTGEYAFSGVAISGCYIPDRRGRSQEADLVIITPQTTAVIEVKGTVPEAMSGVLSTPANGRWHLSGYTGDPVRVRDSDTNPIGQARTNSLNLKNLAEPINPKAFVATLVLVVPPRRSTMTLQAESLPVGCDVLLGSSQNDLRAWFHRASRRRETVWTAEQVHALLAALNFADAVGIDDLVAEGFPTAQASPATAVVTGNPGIATVTPLPSRPPTPAPAAAAAPPSSSPGDLGRSAGDAVPDYSSYAPTPAAAVRRPSSGWGQRLAATGAIVLVGGGVWVLAQACSAGQADPAHEPVTHSTSVEEAVPPAEASPAPERPAPAPGRAPTQGCYPFQSNC